MKRTKKLLSHSVELFTLELVCPYCDCKRKYRSLNEEPVTVKCKCCKKEFMIDYELGDEEAWIIKQGYFVNYIGGRDLGIKVNLGLCISGDFWDEITETTCIWVKFDNNDKYAINIYDLQIDYIMNEDNW